MGLTRSLAVGFGVLLAPCLAAAALVTVEFSGEVSGYGSFVPPPASSGSMAPGDPVHGFFRYDTEAIDVIADPHLSRSTTLLNSFEATLGQVQVVPDPADPVTWFRIDDDAPDASLGGALIDGIGVGTRAAIPLSPVPIERLNLQLFLVDPSHSVFQSDAIPATVPDLALFAPPPPLFFHAQGQLTTETGAPVQVFVNFNVTEWHVVPEPLPATLSMGLLVASLLLRARRSA